MAAVFVSAQPSGPAGMQLMAVHSNLKHLPLDYEGKRSWSYSLFGCFNDLSTCLTALFCPCIVYSRVNSRLNHLAFRGSPHPEGGDSFGPPCLCYAATCICGGAFCLQVLNREHTRSRYNISGNVCTDFLTSCCCHVCDLVQESREIELEEETPGGSMMVPG